MADALLIEIAGDTVGIAVKEEFGFRFFASEATYFGVDGRVFETVGQVHAAVRSLRPGMRGGARGQLQSAA